MTPAETAAAREFRAAQRSVLAAKHAMPPDLTTSVYAKFIRHECAARGGASVALELREHYRYSPAYLVGKQGDVIQFDGGDPGWSQEVVDLQEEMGPRHLSVVEAVVPARRFGWIWTQGRCAACGMTALSKTGRLVDPQVRPPSEHAIVS